MVGGLRVACQGFAGKGRDSDEGLVGKLREQAAKLRMCNIPHGF
jgi:hypothetical protein